MTILTDEFAKELNDLHDKINNNAKLTVAEAIFLGEKLFNAQAGNEQLGTWMDEKLTFSRRTAFRYVDLFTYRSQIKESENIFGAYKMLADVKAQQKQAEYQKSADRVKEYKETGVKPEGWIKDTDTRRVERMEAAQNDSCQNAPIWERLLEESD